MKGVYVPAEPVVLEDTDVISWLIEAAFIATGSASAPLKTLSQSPALFPFKIGPYNSIESLLQRRLEVHRHGLDEPIVARAR